MEQLQVIVATDWWVIVATILSGILAAAATIIAVVYTNKQTKIQLKQQEEKYAAERKEQIKQSKYVVIKPSLLLTNIDNFLDRLLVQNDYNRVLLFSGEDGFEFYDRDDLRQKQTCRFLVIENNTENDIVDISIQSSTILTNRSTDKKMEYSTSNKSALLRSHEKIIMRLADQRQFESILAMNKEKIPHDLSFDCKVVYSTLANQRINYHYKVKIVNDIKIEVECDEIDSVVDNYAGQHFPTSTCRNLQDTISSIDRSAYYWQKMARYQIRGMRDVMQEGFQTAPNNNNTSDETVKE